MEYYTLNQLAQETGVSRHRIKSWMDRGIIPRGVNAANGGKYIRANLQGVYTYQHVRDILTVARLLDENRKLEDIRDYLNPLFGERP